MPTLDATYDRLADLRATAPVSEIAPGCFFVASHPDAVRVLGNDERFGCQHAGTAPPSEQTLFEATPEDHARRRRLISAALAPDRVAKVQPEARRVAHDLVDGFADVGAADLVAEFADPLTASAVASLVGIAAPDRAEIYAAVRTIQREQPARSHHPAAAPSGAAQCFRTWALGEAARRRAMPDPPDDGITVLLGRDPVTGLELSDDELVIDIRHLCQSGLGATRRLIANALHELALCPDRYRRLGADPSLATAAVEESLRHDSPTKLAKRTCAVTSEVAGITINPGDIVFVSLASANRDDTRFTCGGLFDLERARPRPHVAFGWGAHRCPGASLARMIAIEALHAVLDGVADLRLADGYQYEELLSLDAFRFLAPRRLPVVFRPRSRRAG